MADKRKLVLSIYLLPFCIVLIFAQNKVTVEPTRATILNGQNVTLLCKGRTSIIYCRFDIPSTGSIRVIENAREQNFSYYGGGFKSGECGIQLRRVDLNNNGKVNCTLGYEEHDEIGSIDLIVGLEPRPPQFENFNDQPLNTGDEFRDRCIVADGRPEANISFFLDNEEIIRGVANPEEYNQDNAITSVRAISFRIEGHHNGKTLTCRAEHFAYPNGYKEKKIQLRVKYAPISEPVKTIYGLQLERTAFVTVTIHSNPRPQTLWQIDNNINVNEGKIIDRYEAQAPTEIADGEWNVTLVIGKLTLQDTVKTYKLIASNELGRQEYIIKISPSDAPISDLDLGAIIGIAVACIIVIVVIGLIIAARATGRWCFAENSNAASSNINSDEENGPLKSIGQHIIPFKQRLLGMVARAKGISKQYDESEDVVVHDREVNDEENEKMSTETAIVEDDISVSSKKHKPEKKDQNQLIYAELDIKTQPVVQTGKNLIEKPETTEYAEILYVSPQTSASKDDSETKNKSKSKEIEIK